MSRNEKLDELRQGLEELRAGENPPRMQILLTEVVLENLAPTNLAGADHGLCEDQQCQTCSADMAAIVQQVENRLFEDLEAAAQSTGLQREADLLATAFNNYRQGQQFAQEQENVFHLEGFGPISVR